MQLIILKSKLRNAEASRDRHGRSSREEQTSPAADGGNGSGKNYQGIKQFNKTAVKRT